MDVSIVVTCWNGRKLLERNLPYVIDASKNPKNKIIEIIVIDDGSTDDSVEFVKKTAISKKPASTQRGEQLAIRVVEHKKNFGYATTCNTGVREAKGDLVAILNLDVIPSENFLEAALPHFDDEKIFAVSFNEGKFGPGKLIWKNGFLEIESNNDIPKTTAVTDWPSGGSSVFRKSHWEKLGGMDRIFSPFYFEDIDLGIKAHKAGFSCLWEPKAKVGHKHEGTINSSSFNLEFVNSIKQRNHLLLVWKNIDSFESFSSHIVFLLKRCFFHPGYFKIVFLAVRRLIIYCFQNKK